MRQHARDRLLIDAAAGRIRAGGIAPFSVALAHEVVDQRVAGAGVAGIGIGHAVEEGDVRDPADIEHRDRVRAVEHARERAMIDRHERRALPSRGDVGRAEITDDPDPERAREHGTVADLHRQPALRPVQDGLAMKPDDVDRACVEPVGGEESAHRLRVQPRRQRLGLRDRPRTHAALGKVLRRRNRGPQKSGLGVGVGIGRGRPEAGNRLPVALDQGDVDAVHRRAAHQPDRAHRPCPRSLNPAPNLIHHRRHRGDKATQ